MFENKPMGKSLSVTNASTVSVPLFTWGHQSDMFKARDVGENRRKKKRFLGLAKITYLGDRFTVFCATTR